MALLAELARQRQAVHSAANSEEPSALIETELGSYSAWRFDQRLVTSSPTIPEPPRVAGFATRPVTQHASTPRAFGGNVVREGSAACGRRGMANNLSEFRFWQRRDDFAVTDQLPIFTPLRLTSRRRAA